MTHQHTIMLITLMMSLCATLRGQNLVPNGGFEVQDTCPALSQITIAHPWTSPTTNTPDLFNTNCNSQHGWPRTGIGCAGIFGYAASNSREYLQVQLTSPLVAGSLYVISFYVLRLHLASYAIDRMGAYLSIDSVYSATNSALVVYFPTIEYTGGILSDDVNYTLISDTIVAAGGEEYLLIGNFRDNNHTAVVDIDSTAIHAAYYHVDDVSIVGIATNLEETSNTKMDFIMMPNPSNGHINVQLIGNLQPSEIFMDIMSIDGKTLWQESYGNGASKSLDLSNWAKGVYIVRMYSDKQFIGYKKIVLN